MRRKFSLAVIAILATCAAALPPLQAQGIWIDQSPGGTPPLFWACTFADASTGWVVGENGAILKTDDGGASWTAQSSGVSGYLSGVGFVGDEGWACGAAGVIIHTTNGGATWSPQTSGVSANLYHIFMTSTTTGFICGASKTILRTTDGGTTWTAASPPGTSVSLYGICAVGTTVYACGSSGRILKSSDGGATWNVLTTSFSGTLEGIQFLDANTGYLTGDGGIVLKTTDGTNFTQHSTGAASRLYACWFMDQDSGWTIATGTNIYKTTTGGTTWVQQSSPVSTPMYGMDFANSSNGWAVGFNGKIIHYTNLLPKISAPPAHDWGNLVCTNQKTDSIAVSNIGSSPLIISSAAMGGANASEFTLQYPSSFPVSIAPGDSILFRILWTAATPGPKTAGIWITSNDPDTPVWSIHFTAVKNTLTVTPNPATLDFGPACVGASVKMSLLLNPVGDITGTAVDFFRVSGDSDYVLTKPALPFPLSFSTPNQMDLEFRPTHAGPSNAIYAFRIEPCGMLVQVTLKGLGRQSLAQILPSGGHDFGMVEVGKSSTQPFKIQGGGNTQTRVTGIAIDPPTPGFTLNGLPAFPVTLAPTQEKSFTLQFAPAAEMQYNARICVHWDAECPDSLCVPIAGLGFTRPRIAAPGAKVMQNLLCSNAEEDTILVRNNGGAPLEINSAAFTGPQAARFSLSSPVLPISVLPGDSVRFIVHFTDNTVGPKSATLVLTHNDTQNSPTTVAYSLFQNIVSYAVQGDSLQPVESCVGSATSRSLKIFNDGSVPVKIRTLSVIQNGTVFHVSGNTLPVTIDPNQNSPFEINFTPLTTGMVTGKILIEAEPCGVSSLLSIDGLGIRTIAQSSPPLIQFGDVKIGTSSDQAAEITNNGTLSTIVEGFFLSPPTPGLQIVQQPVLPQRFNTGEKFSVSLRFSPTVPGPVTASLCFRTSTPCADTICIPVSGNGIAASISVNRSAMYYTPSPCSTAPVCDTVTVSNAGSSTVEVTDISIVPAGIFTLQPKPALPMTLKAGETRPVAICASALFTGSRSATLSILSSDPQRPRIDIPLDAKRDSANVMLSSQGLDFGTLMSCDSGKTLSLRITNSGTLGEIITSSSLTEPAFTLAAPFPLLLQPGETKQIDIRFSPLQFRSYRDSLILETRNCRNLLRLLLAGARVLPSYASAPAAIPFSTVDIGSTATQTMRVTNGNSFKAHLLRTTIAPPTPELTVNTGFGGDFDPGGFADFTLKFTPTDTLIRNALVCFIIDLPCPDTLCVPVSGRGVRGSIAVSKQQMQFAPAAQCEFRRDTIVCRNNGSAPITLTGTSITGPGAAFFTVVNPVSTPEALNPGTSRALFVEFRPAAAPDGIVNAALQVRTTDSQRPQIDISLQGVRITQQLPVIPPLDFGSLVIGSSRALTMTLRNNGTSRFCFRELRLPAAVTTTATFPICLNPGEQQSILLTFTPADTSILQDWGTLVANQPCDDSTRFSLLGKGFQSEILQTPAVHFGTVPSCARSIDTIFVENESTSPVELISVGRLGADLQWFDVLQPLTFPVTIPAKTRLAVVISFFPQAGNSGFKQVTYYTEVRVDTSVRRLLTRVDATGETPSYALSDISFASTVVGDTAKQSITIPNRTAYPARIAFFSFGDPAFSLVSASPPLPAILKPGESLNVVVRFVPSAARQYTGALTMSTDIPCSMAVESRLDGAGLPPNILSVNALIPQYHGRPDEIITMEIRLDRNVGAALVRSWAGDIRFNRTMLYPLAATRDSALSANQTVTFTYDQASGTGHLAGSGAPLPDGSAPLVRLRAKVLVGNDVETPLTLSPSFDFTSGNARIAQRAAGLFQLEGYCRAGDRLLRLDGTNTLHQNTPNPFGEGSAERQPATTIVYETAFDGPATLVLFDAMGRRVRTLADEWKPAGRHILQLDAGDLPGGMYYYTLQCGRFRDVKKMIVVH